MTSPIRCLITDDEPFARKGLQRYVEQTPFLELRGLCADTRELTEHLRRESVDLLFLDIEMPGLSGVDFLRQQVALRPRVVLTTAFEQYALAGFELDVLDYLLKPVSAERFQRAAYKARDYFQLRDQPEPRPGYFFVKANGRLEKVAFAEILYLEALENYVTIHTTGGKIMTHSTLKALHARLPAGCFVQTHKSYVVAPQHITAIDGNLIQLGLHQVPVSKLLRARLLARPGFPAAE